MAQRDMTSYHLVSPDYFRTLEIPIVRGRAFTDGDTTDGQPVCIVSETFVERHFKGRDPIGARILLAPLAFGGAQERAWEIVGVARQVKTAANEPQPFRQVYVPLAQNAWWTASLIVRPEGVPAETLAGGVRTAITRVDKDRAVSRLRTIDTIEADATSRPRFRAVLVGTFAALALVLAMVGVFGVLAYAVEQRTREFGVRVALGASRSDVLRLVMLSAARVTGLGGLIGLAAAAVFSRSIATLLFGVEPLDPITFISAGVLLAAAAAIATAAPALRASRVDPVVAFRAE
jgi:putative ABC transport system permease protein